MKYYLEASDIETWADVIARRGLGGLLTTEEVDWASLMDQKYPHSRPSKAQIRARREYWKEKCRHE